ncbi:MAG TPA: glucokinase [Bryobacteraceae bacterium]|nr:glucokinase [Bryobacteraceae bacterium]
MILAGDIGGTNTRLAFFDGTIDNLKPHDIEVFPSPRFKGLGEIIQKYLSKHKEQVDAACFGLPGAVVDGKVMTPNLPWVVDAGQLALELHLGRVELINDLFANAHGIAMLHDSDFVTLNEGIPSPTGNRALISAGTGLGEAGLLAEVGSYRPFPSEGGHVDFAPRNELEIELLRHLMGRFGRVSYERVLSGPGLFNIYQFLRDTGRAEEPAWLAEEIKQGDPAAAVAKAGLAGKAEISVQTLDIFVSIYGAEAGNLALKVVATGGVFIGGGIAPKIIKKLSGPAFMKSFSEKGRVSPMMRNIPVRVITNDKTALLGAGRFAALQLI